MLNHKRVRLLPQGVLLNSVYYQELSLSTLEKSVLIFLGWDPIFEYEGETYAEMEPTKKNLISHRSLALSGFRKWLETHTYG